MAAAGAASSAVESGFHPGFSPDGDLVIIAGDGVKLRVHSMEFKTYRRVPSSMNGSARF